MKTRKIIVFLAALALFSSCQEPLGIEDNLKVTSVYSNILPMAVGNYWIYDVTRNSEQYTDSVVVTSSKFIDNMKVFEFSTYRDGVFAEKNFFAQTSDKILMYSQVLEPLLDTIDCYCESGFNYRWIQIGKLGKIGSSEPQLWSKSDTSSQIDFPVSYTDEGTEVRENLKAVNILNIDVALDNLIKFENAESTWKSASGKLANYSITGKRYSKLDTTGISRLKGYRNSLETDVFGSVDENTYLIQNIQLNLNFKENIGIIESTGSVSCPSSYLFQSRRLIRYKVN